MDISLKHEDYKILTMDKEYSVEENIEAEFLLPQYMPEILKVIKVTAEPKITSCKALGTRIDVDGVCELRVIYTAEDDCIYTFSQSKPFSVYCEKGEFENAIDFNASAKVDYVNCRATGTRKAELKASVLVKIKVFYENCVDIISLEKECGVQTKTRTVGCLSLGCKKTRSFSMSDTINLATPSAFIISEKAVVLLSETRRVSNKLMLKGDVIVEICYVNSDNRALAEHINHTIPLNQILEIEGLNESFIGDVQVSIKALDIILKGEHDSFTSAFDLSLGLDASVTMWEEKELALITDAYGVDTAVASQKSTCAVWSLLDRINDTYLCDNGFKVPGEGVSCVVDAMGDIAGLKHTIADGSLNISGSLCVSFIIRDINNSLTSVNKAFDFSYKRSADYAVENIICEPIIDIVSIKCSIKNNDTIELRAEMKITASVYNQTTEVLVTEISADGEKLLPKRAPIVVYFPNKENEPLWDIAKKYGTTVSAIANENELNGDTTEGLRILFIPSA